MLNQIVIVGRLTRDPELRSTEGGKKVTNITLAIPRSYKNSEGVYETDFVDCVLWTGLSCELFKLFNIIGMCRFDFLVGNDKIYFLEGNLIPGFSSESAMPMMLKQANISLSDFMENLVRSYLRKQKNSKYLPYHID